jgi:thiol-disulfide isomerase/thioredoxin
MSKNAQRDKNRQRSFNRRVMALFLSGAGLLIIATVALILLPRTTSTSAQDNVEEIDYQSAVPIKVDYPAPELDLVSLEGEAVSLRDFRGQVVLVNNWAFWCPPCRAEMPALEKYYQAHKSQDFTVIAVEAGDQFEDVDYHVKSFEMSFPVWLDPYEKSLRAFNSISLPNSVVIDAQGQVRLAWTGPITYKTLEKYVTPLLEE